MGHEPHLKCNLGPCRNAWTLSCSICFVCVHIFFTVPHPLNSWTQYGNGVTPLYRTCRWDARRERAIPIRLDNFGLTGVVCWGAFQTQISDYIIVFIFETFVWYLFPIQKMWFPPFLLPPIRSIFPHYIHKHWITLFCWKDIIWLSCGEESVLTRSFHWFFVSCVCTNRAGSYPSGPAPRPRHRHGV